MADLCHQFGADLTISPTGDIQVISAPLLTQQRLLRRLLTNQGDYIWHLGYGAGLARFVGQRANAAGIAAIVRSQIFKESDVARTPEPVIDVLIDPTGIVTLQVRYADASTGETQTLSFSVGS